MFASADKRRKDARCPLAGARGKGWGGPSSGEARIRVARHKLLRGAVVDESFLQQPTHCPALSSNITKGVPRRNQLRVVLMIRFLG